MTKDLQFVSDGNPDLVGTLLNVSKVMKIADIIFSFTSLSDIPYLTSPGDPKWALLDFTPFTDMELDWWSKLVEPHDREERLMELYEEFEQQRVENEQLKRKLEQVREGEGGAYLFI